ncbi:MAG: HEAT repeat domain-containing protein [Candidatus Heimdallarchaeota archaeon]
MLKEFVTKQKFISVLKNRFKNWEEKGRLLTYLISQDDNGKEIFMKFIDKHRDKKLRKSAASAIKYMDFLDKGPILVSLLFTEKEWTVRYAIAKSCAHLMGVEAINEYNKQFTELLNETKVLEEVYNLKKMYAECLGAMGLSEAIPILTEMLNKEKDHRDAFSNNLKLQIMYSLGEIGDESVVDLLYGYSDGPYSTSKGIQSSAEHALDKIARKLGYTSKRPLMNARMKK